MDTPQPPPRQEKILHVRLPLRTYRRLRHEAIERGLTNTQLLVELFAEPETINPNQPAAG